MTNIRINKYLADAGLMSRRKADEAISNGEIKVNGTVSRELGIKINPDKDVISFKGKEVKPSRDKFTYYALNKPKGIISTANDEKGRKNVLDFVPESPRVFPVGRLDANSEGLIILTNDGDLTQRLTHPSFLHQKEYFVVAKNHKRISLDSAKNQMKRGIRVGEDLMKADEIEISEAENKYFEMKLILHTGHNRQIRRMCDRIGLEVIKLVRTRIVNLLLSDLQIEPGEYKVVTKEQIL